MWSQLRDHATISDRLNVAKIMHTAKDETFHSFLLITNNDACWHVIYVLMFIILNTKKTFICKRFKGIYVIKQMGIFTSYMCTADVNIKYKKSNKQSQETSRDRETKWMGNKTPHGIISNGKVITFKASYVM